MSGKASRREISKVVTESRCQLVKVRIKQICEHECDAVTRLQNIRAHKNHTCPTSFYIAQVQDEFYGNVGTYTTETRYGLHNNVP